MRWVAIFLVALAVLAVAASAWVRLAPSEAADWHQPPDPKAVGDYPAAGGFEAVRSFVDPGAVTALHEAILATPRTRVLAGSVEEGLVTYVTRSRVMGFPDYTTVAVDGNTIAIRGRLRFGSSDLGVNRARIEGWLAKVDGFSRP